MSQAVTELVVAAARGDQQAWDGLVDRYMPLVVSVVRKYRLRDKDAEDVSQTVWLRLVEHIDTIREPRALPGWIVVTTRNEALRVLRGRSLAVPVDFGDLHAHGQLDIDMDSLELDDGLLRAERRAAILDGLAELPPYQRRLLLLLVADPPVSYEEISLQTGMPVGSIGPTRARCLAKLRATAPLRALLDAECSNLRGGGRQ
jgi:RNA polymerase sigma factor (sigma-70 family)